MRRNPRRRPLLMRRFFGLAACSMRAKPANIQKSLSLSNFGRLLRLLKLDPLKTLHPEASVLSVA
jgi:hypothetical protein